MTVVAYRDYDAGLHRFNFAAWAAQRAAARGLEGLNAALSLKLLGVPDLRVIASKLENLPSIEEFDRKHREWRCELIRMATPCDLTHGRAAKLINVYLKALLLDQFGSDSDRPSSRNFANYVHPPIDRILLRNLSKNAIRTDRKKWRELMQANWTMFDSQTYEAAVDLMRHETDHQLWKIEALWSPT